MKTTKNEIDIALCQGVKLWQNVPLSTKVATLTEWSKIVTQSSYVDDNVEKMIRYQCQRAEALIAQTDVMPGPTGESNELYTTGRGVFYILADEEAPVAGLVGLVAAALVAGNAIIIAFSQYNSDVVTSIAESLYQVSIPKEVVQLVDISSVDFNHKTLSGVCFIGTKEREAQINKQLAEKEGSLGQLISETDLDHLSQVTDPYLIFRLITERTRTINITAVGGNADLLVLGGGDH